MRASCARRSAAGPIGRSATRSRSAPAPATSRSTCCRPGSIERADRDRHLARDAGGARGERRRARARGRGPSRPRPRRCPSRTRASTSSSATRSSTTSPTSSGPSPSSAACCGPAGRSPSAASPRATATSSRRCRSGPALLAAPLWRRLDRGLGPRHECREPSARTATTWSARSTCTPSPPATCAASARGGPDQRSGSRGEELLATIHGWTVRTLEASAEPDEVPWAWRRFAFRSYSPCSGWTTRCSSRACRPQLFYNLLVAARKPDA